jgi:hypothetical protein
VYPVSVPGSYETVKRVIGFFQRWSYQHWFGMAGLRTIDFLLRHNLYLLLPVWSRFDTPTQTPTEQAHLSIYYDSSSEIAADD